MPQAEWRKSSYSDGEDTDQSACVEVAFAGNRVGVRDSKRPAGAPLSFPADAWSHFLRAVREA
ncbi:DUF397 domain-containing protein [Amycolatopsis cihanbeyliensis]|uniref:Uncharacterized protein DUF397 n=1 Tax=Amycolatopsis cihanbeyliensis TaxID=1128664 RepID=A0A542CUI6_AMYCI|nr:DUF397 domain-containing protein [Amycolatopsis cihanbeyliensis]TQI94474.1 uncharacterized protein DUF397 [Amycolatopsis cihanbeyliensis]